MDNDLISRSELKKAIEQYRNQWLRNCETDIARWDSCKSILETIDNAPTVYPKQGEWIKHISELYPNESTEECPFCHEEQTICGNDDNFCPNCGAKMKGGAE